MSLQDPPLDFKEEFQSNAPFSKDEFKAYTKLGQYIDFVVWPPLLLYKRGPLLAKGVAQGWGKAEGGIKSPDVKNTEPSFPVERKQAWTSVANQAVSNPSTLADNSYSQSPLVPALTYPVSTVTYTQAPLTYNQALSPSSSDNRVLSQPTTTTRSTAEMQLSDILRDIAVNQNSNATQPYSQQTVGQHSSNDTQQGSVPQTFYENQGNQSGASQYGHGYHFNGYYYHY